MAGTPGQDVVALAEQIVAAHVPYVYGGTTMSGFDCSGLTRYLWGKAGVNIPRTSEEQATVGQAVTRDQLQPGDLIFSQWPGDDASPGHVAIYAGSGQLIEAPHTGEDVHQIALDSSYESHVTGYRRPSGGSLFSTLGTVLSSPLTAAADATGTQGLFALPGEIIGFFSKATDDLTQLGTWFSAFTRPSTWVRIGSGAFGCIAIIAGLFFFMREARS